MSADRSGLDHRLTWILGAGSCLAMAALGVRVARTGKMWFAFMAWNLVLALVPYFLARLLEIRWRRSGRVGPAFVMLGLGWLVFFPNAPYVLTDVVHLGNDKLWWYDLPLVMSFAGTSWLAGLMSLAIVDDVLERSVGKGFARAVVLGSCWLSGLGVYVGRFLRFNSWDVVQSPWTLTRTAVERFVPPWRHPQPHTFALFFALLLFGSYVTFRVLHGERRAAE